MDSIDKQKLKKPTFSPLHKATLQGDLNEIKRLIKEGENPLDPDIFEDTLLHHAATVGELEILKYLVEECHCLPAVRGWKGTTPLHSAAQAKQFNIIRFLIEECKVDPTDVDDNDQYPLHYAYRFGNLEFVRYLMESMREYMKNKDVESVLKFDNICCESERTYSHNNPLPTQEEIFLEHIKSVINFTPIQRATEVGNLRAVRSLATKLTHEELNSYKHSKVFNCLHLAVEHGHFPLVHYFVKELKFDPLFTDMEGNNSLYIAIHVGNLDLVKLFIEKFGCDPLRKDDKNYTPLHVASMTRHLSVLKYLIEEKGCDLSVTDGSRTNALHNAAHFGHLKSIQYLLGKQMDQNEPNNDGFTVLSIAAIEGHLEIVKYLLKLDTTVHYDRKSRTPMYYAAGGGHFEIVKYLLNFNHEMYSFVVRLAKSHSCPLPYATQQGHFEIVKYLVNECECDPFMLGDKSLSLMHYALLCRRYKLVQFFLQKVKHMDPSLYLDYATLSGEVKVFKMFLHELAVSPDTPDKDGTKPIIMATAGGHFSIVKCLVEEFYIDADEYHGYEETTALHASVSGGHLDIVKFLISDIGVDPFPFDKQGNTPLHDAASKNQDKVVRYMLHV